MLISIGQMRKQEEQEELKRQQEEERLRRLTRELEHHVDPGTLTRSQKDSMVSATFSIRSLVSQYIQDARRT
jgi:hypothetical protein